MPQNRTAAPTWDKRDGYWYCRPWVGGVRQKRVRARQIAEHDLDLARRWAAGVQTYCDAHGCVPGERDLTFAEYVRTYLESKAHERSYRTMKASLENHAVPRLGTLPMRGLNRDVLLGFVHALDSDVRAGKYGASNAENIWYTTRAMLRGASKAKNPALRVLDFDPTDGVPAPDPAATTKAKQLLFPDEFSKLLACPDVPISRARLYAVALLAHARSAELRPLAFADTDIEHRAIRITKQYDEREAKIVPTKGKKAREVTMEETLVPLLATMRAAAGGAGLLFPACLAATATLACAPSSVATCSRPVSTAPSSTSRPRPRSPFASTTSARAASRGAQLVAIPLTRSDRKPATRTRRRTISTSDGFDRSTGPACFPSYPRGFSARPRKVAARWPHWPHKSRQNGGRSRD